MGLKNVISEIKITGWLNRRIDMAEERVNLKLDQ